MKEEKINKITRYPTIFVHGIFVKDFGPLKAFGKLPKLLTKAGYKVYFSDVDSFGTIENNASILKREIEELLKKTSKEKVNIIAHSKGGIDSRYLISKLDMKDKVANLITIATPHNGSELANDIISSPRFFLKILNFFINIFAKIYGDNKPNAYVAGIQLTTRYMSKFNKEITPMEGVNYYSYSTCLVNDKDDFLFSLIRKIFKSINKKPNDGMVQVDSMKYGIYLGDATNRSLSHRQIINYLNRKNLLLVKEFYISILDNLIKGGY